MAHPFLICQTYINFNSNIYSFLEKSIEIENFKYLFILMQFLKNSAKPLSLVCILEVSGGSRKARKNFKKYIEINWAKSPVLIRYSKNLKGYIRRFDENERIIEIFIVVRVPIMVGMILITSFLWVIFGILIDSHQNDDWNDFSRIILLWDI